MNANEKVQVLEVVRALNAATGPRVLMAGVLRNTWTAWADCAPVGKDLTAEMVRYIMRHVRGLSLPK